MSQRVIDDPELAGWELDPDTGYWMWKGEEGTGGLWEQNGDDIYYSDGKVGIGTDDPKSTLHVDGTYISVTGGGTYGYLEPLGTSFQIGISPSSTVKELTLATSGQTRMTVDASGNVGFGGEAAGWGSGQTTLEIIGKSSGQPTASGAISFKTQDATTGFATIYSPAGTLEFWTGSFADNQRRLAIGADGRVDITGSLYVNGSEVGSGGGGLPDGDYTHNGKITATDFISTSDERLKENITPMPIGLIDDIKPVSWEWKDGSGPSAGVVAQQLQSVGLGDYVIEDEDGQLGVNYQALTAILLAEVIELKRSLK